MGNTNIEYATKTWNPVIGCTNQFRCFERCWARGLTNRFATNPQLSDELRDKYRRAFTVGPQLFPERLDEPIRWKKPQVVFVCSQGDLLHDDVPEDFILSIWDVMLNKAPQHTYLLLTKRPERGLRGIVYIEADNIYLGVSVEDQATLEQRWSVLSRIPAAKKWISFEPLLNNVKPISTWVRCGFPDWAVIGCESGSGRRPCNMEWVEKIIYACRIGGVPLFIKQLPDPASKHIIKMPKVHGKVWRETPWRKQ